MLIANKNVLEVSATDHPTDGDILQYSRKSDLWAPAGGAVMVSATPTAGDVLVYNSVTGKYDPLHPGNIPVSVAGVTATTLNAALLEIFTAIP